LLALLRSAVIWLNVDNDAVILAPAKLTWICKYAEVAV
jgi:hypothetical protein